jgi:hypothetical protein
VKLLIVLALVACSGHTSTPVHPSHGSGGSNEVSGSAVAEAAPNDADCDALIAHAVALAAAERPEHTVTDDDQTHARSDLRAEYAPRCRAMSRASYLCALSAPSLPSLADCDHATRSSSTSNSSVAPGGMTPAAPRSP